MCPGLKSNPAFNMTPPARFYESQCASCTSEAVDRAVDTGDNQSCSLAELSEQRLAGFLRRSPALFLKTCDLETQLSNQANEIKASITSRHPPHPPHTTTVYA